MNNLIRLQCIMLGIKSFQCSERIQKRNIWYCWSICETADIFVKDNITQRLQKDDLVIICSVGAYGSCMASDYNLRGKAKEIFIKNKIINE